MDIITALVCVAIIYLWFLFIDRFLKSCSHYAYIQFLKGTGLEINIFQIKWTTTAFNRTLAKWGASQPKFFQLWFSFGLIASLTLLPISIYLLFIAFFQNFSTKPSVGSLIEPALPGVNLPASEIGYYSVTLLLSSLFHELGHALAAAQEDINLINVGANVLFILPVAYVNINSDKLFSLNVWKRLKILCAGVWHNLFLAVIAYLLYISLPVLFSPIFTYNNGVTVTKVHEKSPVLGPKGVNVGDIITRINDCDVGNEDLWFKCLSEQSQPGFCIESDVVDSLDESIRLEGENGVVKCCSPQNHGKICFEYLDIKDSVLELPQYACLPGRTVVKVSQGFCTKQPHFCPLNTFCFRPVLANHTNLFKIERMKGGEVIFIGFSSDLASGITVSSFVPKHAFYGTSLPDVCSKLSKYVIVFSIGLAIVNILPCLFMDGQFITNTLLHLFFSSQLRTIHINAISAIVTTSFTFILIIHCVVVFYSKLS